MSRQSKRWCFTWNNYTDAALQFLSDVDCSYLIFGKEVGDSGTPHLQGFFTMVNKTSIVGLRKIGFTCHLEPAKGTSLQAAEYCKKENDFTEFGTPPSPGKRTDLEAVAELVKAGVPISTIADEHPSTYMKYGRGIRDLALVLAKPYAHPGVRGLWVHGPPGTGKSHACRELHPFCFLKSQSKWFDGYNGEHSILLDDLDSDCLAHHLKIWADRYPCSGETKGGTVALQHRIFMVTSNFSPEELFDDKPQFLEAIKRRFKVVYKGDRATLINPTYDPTLPVV